MIYLIYINGHYRISKFLRIWRSFMKTNSVWGIFWKPLNHFIEWTCYWIYSITLNIKLKYILYQLWIYWPSAWAYVERVESRIKRETILNITEFLHTSLHEYMSTWAHEYITGLLLSYWGTELSDVAGPTRPGGGVEISSGRVTQNSVTNCSIDPRRPQWNVRENNSSSTIVMPRDTPIQGKRAKGEECPL